MRAGSRAVAKKAYVCTNGPFKGHTLYLTSTPTAYMTVTYETYDVMGVCLRRELKTKETGRYEKVPGYMSQLTWTLK